MSEALTPFDGTYSLPGETPKRADFTDCTKRRPKEGKEQLIIAASVAYPSWEEGLQLYKREGYGTCFHCEFPLGPDDKGSSHGQCWAKNNT